jgi:hypothetical protein
MTLTLFTIGFALNIIQLVLLGTVNPLTARHWSFVFAVIVTIAAGICYMGAIYYV